MTHLKSVNIQTGREGGTCLATICKLCRQCGSDSVVARVNVAHQLTTIIGTIQVSTLPSGIINLSMTMHFDRYLLKVINQKCFP